jgi:hypothetical protein
MSHNTNVSGNGQKKSATNGNTNGSSSVLQMNMGPNGQMTQLTASSPMKNNQAPMNNASNNALFNQQQ